jgi:adenylate kinase
MKSTCAFPVSAILLLGPTGSGKSPLGDLISSRGFIGKRCHHLDFGSELRSISSGIGASFYTTAERDFILGVLENGLLLENEHYPLAEKIIRLFLERSRFHSGDVLVLNGIPRHEGQVKDIASIAIVHSIVVLDCSAESVHHRIENNIGGDRGGRGDDERTLIETKLMIYQDRTAPLIEHYQRSGCSIFRIDVNERTTTGSAYNQLSALAAAHPPVSLVAEPPQR